MTYWNRLIEEVLKKKSTTLNDSETSKLGYKKPGRPKEQRTYFLGQRFGSLYLTRREAECMVHFLEDKTVPETAECLGLSARTVEFYVNNMKRKLACRSKAEMVECVRASEFLKKIDF